MTAPNFPAQTAPSNVTALDDWLKGKAEGVFVLKLEPTDLAGGTATLYLATALYRGAPALPRLLMPQSIDVSILNASFATGERPEDGRLDLDQFRAGQVALGGFGALNNDGKLDDWPESYGWGGAAATLLFGLPTDALASLKTFMVFRVRDEPTWTIGVDGSSQLLWSVKSPVLNPNGLVRTDVFAGTGVGNEGGADLEGKTKPVLVGKVDNINPAKLSDGNLGHMIDPDKVDAIDKVYERGLTVGVAGTDWTNNGTTDGTFDLVRSPIGPITVDAKGWTGAGRTGATSDYSLAANFVILAQDLGGSAAPSTAGLSEDGGIWLEAGADGRFEEVLQRAVKPLGVYFPSQAGDKLIAGEVGSPEDEVSPAFTYNWKHVANVERMPSPVPSWQVRLGYRPLGVTTDALEGGPVTEAEAARLAAAYRYIVKEDTSVQTDYPDSIALDVLSTLYDEADANTLATELLNIYKVNRSIYRVRLVRHPFKVWLGQVVTLDLSDAPARFPTLGLDTAKKVMVTGWSVQFGQSDPHTGSFVMECWG